MDNKVIIAHNAQRTSIAAAEKALPRTGSMRRKVYEFILNRDCAALRIRKLKKHYTLKATQCAQPGLAL